MDGSTILSQFRRAGALALLLIGVGSVPVLADNPQILAAPEAEQLVLVQRLLLVRAVDHAALEHPALA